MLNRFIPNILNPSYWNRVGENLRLSLRLLRDPRVPRLVKAIPVFVFLYIVSPIDLIPGFIPILGQMDDLALLLLGMSAFIRLTPAEVVAEHRAAMNVPVE